MIKEIYIEATVKYQSSSSKTFEMKSILNAYYKVSPSMQRLPDAEVLQKYVDFITFDKVQGFIDKEDTLSGNLVHFEVVYVKSKGKFVQGEYFAHEYDNYTTGKARKITWSSGTVEYEVKCLDTTLRVMDGMWEDYNGNGCGDTFEPYYKGL